MCILLYIINNHYVACTHYVASSVIMMLLVHVFCFLYSAACQSYLCCNHINVFCFMLFVIIMLSVIIRLHHLNYDVTHTYILLLMFCFLYSASCILLLVFCFLYFASCILLFVFCFLCSTFCILLLIFCFLYSASYVLLLIFCFLYFASCILLLIFYFLYSASCILLFVFCFLYSAACCSYSRCSHTDMCILLCITRSHCVVCSYEITSS